MGQLMEEDKVGRYGGLSGGPGEVEEETQSRAGGTCRRMGVREWGGPWFKLKPTLLV